MLGIWPNIWPVEIFFYATLLPPPLPISYSKFQPLWPTRSNLTHGRVLTGVQLLRRGLQLPSHCVMGLQEEETVGHLLLWENSISLVLSPAALPPVGSVFGLLWGLWKERNGRIFGDHYHLPQPCLVISSRIHIVGQGSSTPRVLISIRIGSTFCILPLELRWPGLSGLPHLWVCFSLMLMGASLGIWGLQDMAVDWAARRRNPLLFR
ncbi:hypothetical protein AMTR_s00136p00084130, partial [Amborella trichopoda]